MQLASYLSISRHGIFYIRLPIATTLHPQGKRSDIRVSLETRSPGLASQLSRLLVCACQSALSKASRCSMRYKEISKHVQVHFSDLNRPGFAGDQLVRISRPYRVSSGLHRTPPLLPLAGYFRWAQAGGGY